MKKQITQNRKISFSENQAPLRSKVIRENKKPFVAKTLRKAIMRRSVLNKTVNNLNDPLAIKLYKNQRNYVVSLSQKTKKDYFRNISQMIHLLKTSGNFANISLLIKSQILTTKLCWLRTKRHFLKMMR